MRTQKLFIMSASMICSLSLATAALADDSSSTVTSQTVQTPSNPSVPTTSTTITTQGASATTGASTTAPTSTTTTTSADDIGSATASTPVTTPVASAPAETTTYNSYRPNLPLLITGGALFVGTYVTTAAVAGADGSTRDKDLYIPIAGPWIDLANRTNTTTRDTLLIAGSGALQGIGAAMMVTSFFIPEKMPAARIAVGNVKMAISPTAGGLSTVGTF